MNKLWVQRTGIKGGILSGSINGTHELFLRAKCPGCSWTLVQVVDAYGQIISDVIQSLITEKVPQAELKAIQQAQEFSQIMSPRYFLSSWLQLNLGIFRTRLSHQHKLYVSTRYYSPVSSRANPNMILCNIDISAEVETTFYYLIDSNWILEEHLDDQPPWVKVKKNAEMLIIPERVYLAQGFEEERDETAS